MRFLLLVILSLVFASLITQFAQLLLPDYPLGELFAELFNVNGEYNIPSLYSGYALLFCSILLAIIAYAKKVAGERYVRHWGALSIIFVYISLDEVISLHEKMSDPLRSSFSAHGVLYYPWVIVGCIFVLVFVLAFLKLLADLPAKTRRLFVIAGTVFVIGALGMEMIEGFYADLHGEFNIVFTILTTIEEFLEMLGVAVFIYALLSYISFYMKGLTLRVNIIDYKKQPRSA